MTRPVPTKTLVLATALALFVVSASSNAARAQSLRYKMERIFEETLELNLGGSPGEHGSHFSPDLVQSSGTTIRALTTLIGENLASFPLSSTGATAAYDLSTGVPVRETGSLGPIFSEEGTTLGQGHIILGYNFTHMRLNKIRGLDLDDLQLTFAHQDVEAPGLGDSPNELDTIDLLLDMQLDASILAFYMTAGITDRMDVGVAVPLVNVHLQADPLASVNSFTFASNDSANHFYGGTTTDPILSARPTPINDHATGLGDVALRAKVSVMRGTSTDVAALVEVRLPTGDEENFLGLGSTTVKGLLVGSYSYGSYTPHVNLGYQLSTDDLTSDQLHFLVGSAQQVGNRFTAAVDVMSRFQVNKTAEELRYDQTATMRRAHSDGEILQVVSLTNMPQVDRDNTVDLSVGGKWAPREFLIVLANAIVPLNDAGLRSSLVTTLGFEFNF